MVLNFLFQPNPESRVLKLKPRSSKEAPKVVSSKSAATEKAGRTIRSPPGAGRALKYQQQRTEKLTCGAVRSEQRLEEVHVYTEGGGGVAVHREGSRKSVVKGMKQEFQVTLVGPAATSFPSQCMLHVQCIMAVHSACSLIMIILCFLFTCHVLVSIN